MEKKISKKIIKQIKIKISAKNKPAKKARKNEEVAQILSLNNLKSPLGSRHRKRILGRGPSSGHGKTSTRGSKGQTSRAGRDMYLGFEGGQTPLIRRIPKRGFTNISFKNTYQIVNLEGLAKVKEDVITPEILEAHNLIKNKAKLIKILGDGELKSAKTIQAHAFSRKAEEKIKASGGKAEVLNA